MKCIFTAELIDSNCHCYRIIILIRDYQLLVIFAFSNVREWIKFWIIEDKAISKSYYWLNKYLDYEFDR